MKRIASLMIVMVASLLVAPKQARAQGTSFELRCPSGSALVGVHGRRGLWMDGIGPRCARLNADGSLGTISNAGYAGGTSGTVGSYRCPTGKVMTGFYKDQGTYVDSVWKLLCRSWNSGTRRTTGEVQMVNAWPPAGGTDLNTNACLTGDVGKGLSGRAGIYLDRVYIVC